MILHLGSNRRVPFEQVVALVDLSRKKTADTQALLNAAKAKGRLFSLGEPVKTLVLAKENGEQWCFLTSLSVRSLYRRIHTKIK